MAKLVCKKKLTGDGRSVEHDGLGGPGVLQVGGVVESEIFARLSRTHLGHQVAFLPEVSFFKSKNYLRRSIFERSCFEKGLVEIKQIV